MRSNPRRRTKFGVCIDNTGYPASLEAGKLYAVIADEEAARHGYLRVIDESGEDYAYSAERFFLLDVPAALVKALRPRSDTKVPRPHNGSEPTSARARMSGRG
ncbi:MAG: hypothetical protein ABSF71_37870 [Terriglobia bacterium]|jgi:hypothetical protein